MRKKSLSTNIYKIKELLSKYIKDGDYIIEDNSRYNSINDLLSSWYIECIIDEELTPKGEKVIYGLPEVKDNEDSIK